MLKTIVALCFFTLSFAVYAQDAGSKESIFQKGIQAYQSKQYEDARASFQSLLDQGFVTAEILHNLALTQYQLNQKPLALALWRKALSLDPSLRAARNGRDFTEGELNQRGYERDQITQFLRSLLEYVSLYEALWMVALMIGAAGFLWIRYLGERKTAFDEELPLPTFPTAAVILSSMLVVWVAFTGLKARQSFKVRATVIGSGVNARSLPAEDGVGLFELRGGSEVLIRRANDGWSQVLNSDGSSGWIKNSDLFITSGR